MMECRYVENHLSEYMDRSLAASELSGIADHLHECPRCSELLDNVRSLLASCKTEMALDPPLELIERILLRTSGRPRTRSLRERWTEYVLKPVLTPRFAMGVGLGILFLALTMNLMMPRASALVSALSPTEIFRSIDRTTQQVYSQGLRLYDKKNEWQAQFTFFKNNMFNKLGSMIEQLDAPMEGNDKKSGEPPQQQKKAPAEKSSLLLLRV
jgi:hypothetical protein